MASSRIALLAVIGRVNTLRPRQNGRRFADDTFKWIFLNENVRISIKISLKFVPKGPINNNPALVQIMAWHRQTTSRYLNQWWLVYWRIYASLGLNELITQITSQCHCIWYIMSKYGPTQRSILAMGSFTKGQLCMEAIPRQWNFCHWN